jgi:hypothetical protein
MLLPIIPMSLNSPKNSLFKSLFRR